LHEEKDANGNDVIVHRKGATPAGAGVLGIIPDQWQHLDLSFAEKERLRHQSAHTELED